MDRAVMPESVPPGPPARLVSVPAGPDISALPPWALRSLRPDLPPLKQEPPRHTHRHQPRWPGWSLPCALSRGPSEVRSRTTTSLKKLVCGNTCSVCTPVHVGAGVLDHQRVAHGVITRRTQLWNQRTRPSCHPHPPLPATTTRDGARLGSVYRLFPVEMFPNGLLHWGFPMSPEGCLHECPCQCFGACRGTGCCHIQG